MEEFEVLADLTSHPVILLPDHQRGVVANRWSLRGNDIAVRHCDDNDDATPIVNFFFIQAWSKVQVHAPQNLFFVKVKAVFNKRGTMKPQKHQIVQKILSTLEYVF